MQSRKLAFTLSALLLFAAGDALALDKLCLMALGLPKPIQPARDPEQEKRTAAVKEAEEAMLHAEENADTAFEDLRHWGCRPFGTSTSANCELATGNVSFWTREYILRKGELRDRQAALAAYTAQRAQGLQQEVTKLQSVCTDAALGPAPAQKPPPTPSTAGLVQPPGPEVGEDHRVQFSWNRNQGGGFTINVNSQLTPPDPANLTGNFQNWQFTGHDNRSGADVRCTGGLNPGRSAAPGAPGTMRCETRWGQTVWQCQGEAQMDVDWSVIAGGFGWFAIGPGGCVGTLTEGGNPPEQQHHFGVVYLKSGLGLPLK